MQHLRRTIVGERASQAERQTTLSAQSAKDAAPGSKILPLPLRHNKDNTCVTQASIIWPCCTLAARGVALLLLLGCNIVAAQSALGVGALRGSVLDASEGVVGGATVTLTETSKGWVRTSESAGDGSFLFASVIAGVYSVRVDRSGFATEQMDNLKIEVGQQASVTIRLQPAGVETSVIVTAPTSADLNAQSNTIGSLVDSEQVRELPLNGRNFLQLALLSGGVNEVSPVSDCVHLECGAARTARRLARDIPILGRLFSQRLQHPVFAGWRARGQSFRGGRRSIQNPSEFPDAGSGRPAPPSSTS